MPPRYYEIVRLRLGTGIKLAPGRLEVDLDTTGDDDLIHDDTAFRRAMGEDSYFWISGGGSLILGGRWVPLVQRPLDALTNPGKLSLFTGRADTPAERADPRLMIRELFEELVLMRNGKSLKPLLADAQPLIDQAWAGLIGAKIVDPATVEDLPLRPLELPAQELSIRADGTTRHLSLACHINGRQDINVLFAYAADLTPDGLTARDGEFHPTGTTPLLQGRTIVLYDAAAGTIRPLSEAGPEYPADRAVMTEHLVAFLTGLGLLAP